MKYLFINQLFSLNYNICRHPKSKWGKQQNYNVIGWCHKYNFIVIDTLSIFLSLKQIISIVNYVANNNGVCLTCLLFTKKIILTKNKNFYIVFIDKMYGFLSNFFVFLQGGFTKYKKVTNYRTTRLPDIVFVSNYSWKNYKSFFRTFVAQKILVIKSSSFLQNDINIGYNIMVNDSLLIYNLLKVIYKSNLFINLKC